MAVLPTVEDVAVWPVLDGDQNPTAHVMYAGGTTSQSAVCKGPDGQPWVSVIVPIGPPSAFYTYGPFVLAWDGAAWNLVPGPGLEGGLGFDLTNGSPNPYVSLDLVPVTWLGPTGNFSSSAGNVAQTAGGEWIACDGESVYTLAFYSEDRNWSGLGGSSSRGYFTVLEYGGSWAQLGGAVTHQTALPAARPATPANFRNYLGSLLRRAPDVAVPILRASPGDPGRPVVLYLDVVDTSWLGAESTLPVDWYVSQWDGSSWDDLGGIFQTTTEPTTPNTSMNEHVDMQLDQFGRPTVAWGKRQGAAGGVDSTLHIQTYTGSWSSVEPNLYDVFGWDGGDTLENFVWIALSPVGVNSSGSYRHLLGVTVIRNGASETWIMEYFPASGEVRPLANDEGFSKTPALSGAGTAQFTILEPPVDALGSYWVMASSNGIEKVFRASGCSGGWEQQASVVGSETLWASPPRAYIDRAGAVIYSESLVGHGSTAGAVLNCFAGPIVEAECVQGHFIDVNYGIAEGTVA